MGFLGRNCRRRQRERRGKRGARFDLGRADLRSWHSTTELLPLACVFRYLTVRQGFSRFRGQSIPSRKSIQTMGSDRKMDSKTDSKPRAECESTMLLVPNGLLPLHDINNISY